MFQDPQHSSLSQCHFSLLLCTHFHQTLYNVKTYLALFSLWRRVDEMWSLERRWSQLLRKSGGSGEEEEREGGGEAEAGEDEGVHDDQHHQGPTLLFLQD